MEIDEAQNLGTSLISLLMLMLWPSMIIKIFIKKSMDLGILNRNCPRICTIHLWDLQCKLT